jgi:sugar phosphate isomerase/epimerase
MIETPDKYPHLPKSYKGVYPFKLATTSFIYPDDYIANVRMLGAYFHEIELLLFESIDFDTSFSGAVIDELVRLATELKIDYDVHLPMDISISDQDIQNQRHALKTLNQIIERVSPLAPSTYCLHIPYNEADFDSHSIKKWHARVRPNLKKLLDTGVDPGRISIENLNYPIDLIADIVLELNLSICLDVGHLLCHGYDAADAFNRYYSKISVMHLHGVANNQDHVSLDRLSEERFHPIMKILKRFAGVVSLEVFSFDDLNSSLQYLERCWKNFNSTGT